VLWAEYKWGANSLLMGEHRGPHIPGRHFPAHPDPKPVTETREETLSLFDPLLGEVHLLVESHSGFGLRCN